MFGLLLSQLGFAHKILPDGVDFSDVIFVRKRLVNFVTCLWHWADVLS